jgi:hypothetical protein
MALTEAQKVKIRFYMGWPARFHQVYPELEQAMSAVDSLPDTETQLEAILTDLDSIWALLKGSYVRLKALKSGSTELPGPNEVMTLRSEGRRNVGTLAALLGVGTIHDVFGAGSKRTSIPYGGGNVYPQG